MTEERKKEKLKTIEERISSIPEKYVSKVIADWFFCSGEEDLIEVAMVLCQEKVQIKYNQFSLFM